MLIEQNPAHAVPPTLSTDTEEKVGECVSDGESTVTDSAISESDGATTLLEDMTDPICEVDGSAVHTWINACTNSLQISRRAEVLRRVCAHVLALNPDQRPKRPQGFMRTLRRSLVVKSFTIHPARIAQVCGDPQSELEEVHECLSSLPIPTYLCADSMEDMTEAKAREVVQAWNKVRDSLCNGSSAHWFTTQAFTCEVFEFEVVEGVLRGTGLLCDQSGIYDWSKFTASNCETVLVCLADVTFAGTPWDISMETLKHVVAVPLPYHCRGAMIGKGASRIKRIQSIVKAQVKRASSHPNCQVSLSVTGALGASEAAPTSTVLKVALRATVFRFEKANILSAVDGVLATLRGHIAYLKYEAYIQGCEKRGLKKQQLEQEGLEYQAKLLSERQMKRTHSSAVRALTVPEGGLELAEPQRSLVQPKTAGRHRRWRVSTEKRRTLLQARQAVQKTAADQYRLGARLPHQAASSARRLVRQAAQIIDDSSGRSILIDSESARSACRHVRNAALVPKRLGRKQGKPQHLDQRELVDDCVAIRYSNYCEYL